MNTVKNSTLLSYYSWQVSVKFDEAVKSYKLLKLAKNEIPQKTNHLP
jgi:hypothetical protein